MITSGADSRALSRATSDTWRDAIEPGNHDSSGGASLRSSRSKMAITLPALMRRAAARAMINKGTASTPPAKPHAAPPTMTAINSATRFIRRLRPMNHGLITIDSTQCSSRKIAGAIAFESGPEIDPPNIAGSIAATWPSPVTNKSAAMASGPRYGMNSKPKMSTAHSTACERPSAASARPVAAASARFMTLMVYR
jgi:hypothetical protein